MPTVSGGIACDRRPPWRTGSTASGEAGRVVGDDQQAAERGLAFGGRQALAGHVGPEAGGGALLGHADDAVVVAAHAGIGLVGGAAGQDGVVGGGHVGVGADDEADAAVEAVRVGELLAGGLGVEVGDDGLDAGAELVAGQQLGGAAERAVERGP